MSVWSNSSVISSSDHPHTTSIELASLCRLFVGHAGVPGHGERREEQEGRGTGAVCAWHLSLDAEAHETGGR
eukprot:9343-Eustigmatos_ZCMA.PRE.1